MIDWDLIGWHCLDQSFPPGPAPSGLDSGDTESGPAVISPRGRKSSKAILEPILGWRPHLGLASLSAQHCNLFHQSQSCWLHLLNNGPIMKLTCWYQFYVYISKS